MFKVVGFDVVLNTRVFALGLFRIVCSAKSGDAASVAFLDEVNKDLQKKGLPQIICVNFSEDLAEFIDDLGRLRKFRDCLRRSIWGDARTDESKERAAAKIVATHLIAKIRPRLKDQLIAGLTKC